MHVLVVGSGLLGLTTAWFLRQAGADVTVCDRASAAGMETSFANGGMLHASQASPWNEPGVLGQALRMLGREDSALLIRPRALLNMLPWTWQFFLNSRTAPYNNNLARNTRLAAYSLELMSSEFAELGHEIECADLGTLKIYRDSASLEQAAAIAARGEQFDVSYRVLEPHAVTTLEPALAGIKQQLSGGVHFPDDISGDAHLFCRRLCEHAADAGVRFLFETPVTTLTAEHGRFSGAMINSEWQSFDACVIAAGSYSPALAQSLGIRVPVQPVKGYSLTLSTEKWPSAPRVPVIDEHFHAAVCPLGQRLRVAGTAEFAGFDDTLTAARINNLFALLRQVYPEQCRGLKRNDVQQWTGFRPMTPDGVGITGATPVDGVYLNTGHGHLGWTMAPAAGKLLADSMLGQPLRLDLADYTLARF